jgi:peptide/nickel transport system substrate-binding protein
MERYGLMDGNCLSVDYMWRRKQMKLKSAVFLVLVAVACLSLSSWVLAVEPPRNETLIADILTGKVGNPGNFNFWATWVGNDKGL